MTQLSLPFGRLTCQNPGDLPPKRLQLSIAKFNRVHFGTSCQQSREDDPYSYMGVQPKHAKAMTRRQATNVTKVFKTPFSSVIVLMLR